RVKASVKQKTRVSRRAALPPPGILAFGGRSRDRVRLEQLPRPGRDAGVPAEQREAHGAEGQALCRRLLPENLAALVRPAESESCGDLRTVRRRLGHPRAVKPSRG